MLKEMPNYFDPIFRHGWQIFFPRQTKFWFYFYLWFAIEYCKDQNLRDFFNALLKGHRPTHEYLETNQAWG